jgi:hypothetical protein
MTADLDVRKLVPITAALRKLVEHSRMSETGILDHLTRIGLHEYADEWERQAQELEARIVFLNALGHVEPGDRAVAAGKDAAKQIDARPSQAA